MIVAGAEAAQEHALVVGMAIAVAIFLPSMRRLEQ